MTNKDVAGEHNRSLTDLPAVDGVELRNAMGAFLTGVTIVTATTEDGEPYGLTVNSFNSVSLDPPLVLWSLDNGTEKVELFRQSGGFTVNIMGADATDLIWRFAKQNTDRFTDTNWHWGVSSHPVLDDALVSFECRLWAEYPGGDHAIFVGEVVNISTNDGDPAAFFKGKLGAYKS